MFVTLGFFCASADARDLLFNCNLDWQSSYFAGFDGRKGKGSKEFHEAQRSISLRVTFLKKGKKLDLQLEWGNGDKYPVKFFAAHHTAYLSFHTEHGILSIYLPGPMAAMIDTPERKKCIKWGDTSLFSLSMETERRVLVYGLTQELVKRCRHGKSCGRNK